MAAWADAAAPASAQTPVHFGDTISDPGVYFLAGNQSGSGDGITIESEGDINTTSVWGTGDLSEKPVGLTAVRLKAHLDIDGASPDELDALVAHAAQWSPVLNTVQNPVPVTLARA